MTSATPSKTGVGAARPDSLAPWCPRSLAYGIAVTATLAIGLLNARLSSPLLVIFLVPIALGAYCGGLGPGLVATLLAAVLSHYFLRGSPQLFPVSNQLRWVLLLLTGFLLSLASEALHRAWRRVAESRRRYAVTLSSIGDAVITTDQEGTVTFLNEAAQRLTGWNNREACGQPLNNVFCIFNEQTRLARENPVRQILQTGALAAQPGFNVLVSRSGREYLVDDNGAPIKQDDGKVIGVILVFRDCTEKRKGEQALALFRALIDRGSDGIEVVDPQTGGFLDVSENTCLSLGYSRAEMLALSVSDIDPGLAPGAFEETVKQLRESGSQIMESVHQRKDGTTFPVELNMHFIPLHREYIMVVARDITERKLAEQMLGFVAGVGWAGRREDFLAQLVEHLGRVLAVDYVFVGQVQPGDRIRTVGLYAKGRIVPDMDYSMRGAPCQNVVGKILCHYGDKIQELFPKDHLLEQMGAQSYLGIPLADSAGTPVGLLAILDTKPMPDPRRAADLLRIGAVRAAGELERLAADRALRESEDLYRSLVNTSPDLIALSDPEGRIEFMSARALEVFAGAGRQAVVGRNVFEWIAREDHEKARAGFLELRAGLTIHRTELILLKADGTRFHGEINGAVLCAADGRPRSLLFVTRDITQRKQAEKSLREGSDLLNQIVAQTRCILSFGEIHRDEESPGNSRFHWNLPVQNEPSAQAIFPLELLNGDRYDQAWERSRNADDQIRLVEAFARALRDGIPFQRHEFRCTDKNHVEHWMQQSITLRQRDENHWQVFGITTDISDLKKTADALRESEAKFRSYVENAPFGVFVADAQGQFVDCNPAAIQLLGYDLPTLQAMHVLDIHPSQKHCEARQALAGLAACKHVEGEFELLRRDGVVIWAALRAVVLEDGRSLGFCQDITERKRSEEMQRRLAAAVEQVSEDIIITDHLGNIVYANSAFEKNTGFSREAVIGCNPRFLQSGKHDAAFYKDMWDTLRRGAVWSGQIINKKKDGTLFEERSTISPIRDLEGKITHFVAVKRDVTREIALEAQLRQSQKLEAIGRLAGGIAHDFNNLLTVIRGNASLLLLGGTANASAFSEGPQQIIEAAERAASLTRQLLMFGRKQVIQPVHLDLNDTVAQMSKLLERLLGEDITLTSHYAAGLPDILADTSMIEQVLLNLAVNSRDAMPAGGELTISTGVEMLEVETMEPRGITPSGCFVRLTVADTGGGIKPQNLGHVFEPFFTTKEVGKGTGLGLATVHGIVQQHNGRITVASEVDRGTTFHIYFPAVVGEKAKSPRLTTGPAIPTGSETILVVEDEKIVRLTVCTMLQRFGYTVIAAASGVEAARLWRREKNRVDLLLTDIVMPDGMTGFELAQTLQADKPALKVIYTSGYSADVADKRVLMVEGVNFLQKPYAPQKLAEALRLNLAVH